MSDLKPTVKQQVIDLLGTAEEPMTPSEIAEMIGERSNTVRVVLTQLKRDRLIHQPRYGYYEANPGGFHKFERSTETIAQDVFAPRVLLAAFRVSGRVVAAVEVRVVQLEPAEIIEVETSTPVPGTPNLHK